MLKFSLFIQPNNIDGELNYKVIGATYFAMHGDLIEYQGSHDPTKITTVTIRLIGKSGDKSHLLIKKLVVGSTEMHNMQQWSTYILADNIATKLTHGWIGQPGDYNLKIRYSPMTQNYLSYFLSVSPKT